MSLKLVVLLEMIVAAFHIHTHTPSEASAHKQASLPHFGLFSGSHPKLEVPQWTERPPNLEIHWGNSMRTVGTDIIAKTIQ